MSPAALHFFNTKPPFTIPLCDAAVSSKPQIHQTRSLSYLRTPRRIILQEHSSPRAKTTTLYGKQSNSFYRKNRFLAHPPMYSALPICG